MDELLESLSLSEYKGTLSELGFDDLNFIMQMEKSDFQQHMQGKLKDGHVLKLWMAIDKKKKDAELKISAPPSTTHFLFSSSEGGVAGLNQIMVSELRPKPSEMLAKDAIGKGAFGMVYPTTFKNSRVAVKTFESKDLLSISKEVEILFKLDDENIIKVHGFCAEPQNYGIVMELAENGNLDSVLHSEKGHNHPDISWDLRLNWVEQSCKGLLYLHTRAPPILHRDLKPQNILLRRNWTACLCDFGLSKIEDIRARGGGMTVGIGTPVYQAPEVRKGAGEYATAADIWSMGMILFEIFTRTRPYVGEKASEVIRKLSEGVPPTLPDKESHIAMHSCPPGYIPLMSRCWSIDPEKRPTCKELLDAVPIFRGRGAFDKEAKDIPKVGDYATKEIKQMEEEIKKRDEEIKKQDEEIKKRDEEIKKRNEEIREKVAEILQKEADIQSKVDEIKSKMAEIKRKSDEVVAKSEELTTKSGELRSKTAEIRRKDEEIKTKDADVVRKDEDIKRGIAEIKLKVEEIQIKDTEIKLKNDEIKRKDEDCKRKNDEIKRLEDEIIRKDDESKKYKAKKEEEIKKKDEEIKKKDEEIKKKEEELKKRDEKKADEMRKYRVKEEELKKKEEEIKKREEEFKKPVDELKKKEEEMKKFRAKEDELKKKDEEIKKLQDEMKRLQEEIKKSKGATEKRGSETFNKPVALVDQSPKLLQTHAFGTTITTKPAVDEEKKKPLQTPSLLVDGQHVKSYGSLGTAAGKFSSPRGITSNSKNIYVCDRENHRVQVFEAKDATRDMAHVRSFGSHGKGDGQFEEPCYIAHSDSELFVSDRSNEVVHVFAADGVWKRKIALKFKPNGVAVSDQHCYIASSASSSSGASSTSGQLPALGAGSTSGQIYLYTKQGRLLRQFGPKGKGRGDLSEPQGLCLDEDMLYVADFNNDRVVVFDTKDYKCSKLIGEDSKDILFRPFVVCVHGEYVYVGDSKARVQVFNKKSGDYVKTIGDKNMFGGCISGLIIEQRLLYVADCDNHRIQIWK